MTRQAGAPTWDPFLETVGKGEPIRAIAPLLEKPQAAIPRGLKVTGQREDKVRFQQLGAIRHGQCFKPIRSQYQQGSLQHQNLHHMMCWNVLEQQKNSLEVEEAG